MTTPYRPISCDFHDLLESLATTHKRVRMRFRDDDGVLQERSAAITDVFSQRGAEYVRLDRVETVRLDRLVAVDDTPLADS